MSRCELAVCSVNSQSPQPTGGGMRDDTSIPYQRLLVMYVESCYVDLVFPCAWPLQWWKPHNKEYYDTLGFEVIAYVFNHDLSSIRYQPRYTRWGVFIIITWFMCVFLSICCYLHHIRQWISPECCWIQLTDIIMYKRVCIYNCTYDVCA